MDESKPSSPPPEENSASKPAEEKPSTEPLCDNNNEAGSPPLSVKSEDDNSETKQTNDEDAVKKTNCSNGHSLNSAKSLCNDSSGDLPKSESSENLNVDDVKECAKTESSEHNHCGESNDLPSDGAGSVSVANNIGDSEKDVTSDNVGDSEKDVTSDNEDIKCKSPIDTSGDLQADCDLDKHDESLKSKEDADEGQLSNHDKMEADRVSEGHEEDFRISIESKCSRTTDEIKKDISAENINSDEIAAVPPVERNDVEMANADDKSDQSLSESKAMDIDVSSEVYDRDNNNDDGNNPVFENAPEHNANDSQTEDTSQALDPFDQLFKDGTDIHKEADDSRKEDSTFNEEINELDNEADTTLPEDEVLNDVDDGKGADEEVCLLPDTEREISETDKQKALENKTEFSKDTEATLQISNEIGSHDEPVAPSVPDAAEEEDEDANEETPEVVEESSTAEEKDEPAEKSQDVNAIIEIFPVREEVCLQCSLSTLCRFIAFNPEPKFLCRSECLKAHQEENTEKYVVPLKKIITEEGSEVEEKCYHCWGNRTCRFSIKACREKRYICDSNCVEKLTADKEELYVVKWKKVIIQEIEEHDGYCESCAAKKSCKYEMNIYNEVKFICSEKCIDYLKEKFKDRYRVKKKVVRKQAKPAQQPLLKLKVISNATDKYIDFGHKVIAKTAEAAAAAREDRERSFIRKCEQCNLNIKGDENNLSWETMDFCNETCLGKYQNIIGSKCANCKNVVNDTSLGKYCVRFGYDIRQFCCSGCLEEFKKGLKICCYCHRDISGGYEGFLAPVGEKGQFKDFCSQVCMQKFDQMSKNPIPQPIWAKCAVCSDEKPTQLEVALDNDHSQRLCSEPCFAAFKFVNSVFPDQCRWCKKYFERKSEQCFTIYTETATHCFCSKTCMNVYISNSRHIVPCNWCKVKKYNFDMIRRTLVSGQSIMMCSLNCLTLYQVSVNAVSSRRIKCDECKRTSQAQYHLTMSDATVRNFCTYQCVMSFQGQYTKAPPLPDGEPGKQAVPTGAPRRTYSVQRNNASNKAQSSVTTRSSLPVISNVQSLAKQQAAEALATHNTRGKSKRLAKQSHHDKIIEDSLPVLALAPSKPPKEVPKLPPKPVTPPPPPPPKIYNHILVKTLPPKDVANKATMTKPMMVTKGVSCRPHPCNKECQTDDSLERRVLIPVPIPIYVPVPLAMYSLPFPVPVPIPLPIPTPVFIPTTRNSATGILKEIKKIHEKMPTDPFEAELLMMAEMVAGDKKKNESDSETDDENEEGFSPDAMDGGNNFGEDMLQMALKMATEYDEPPVDLESAMTASTITPSSHPPMQGLEDPNNSMQAHHHHQMLLLEQQRAAAAALRGGRKRPPPTRAPPPRSKRRRGTDAPPPPPEPPREPAEKPDANMCLKYTFGVNAWKQWVMTKNAEIEKSTIRRKPFKSEILQLTADELNYSLCLFVKEVRKPNGSEYAPDTIYYLVLGIQQYLFENGRIDNIFTDPYYEKFTECLDEVARKFSVLYNDSQYIVTRVEEEHLWESKQLGAHSPHVLLSTLMFFNTKHFNLVTVEEHMQLSFSHIMKHWKRNPNQPGAAKMPGSRNVLLRFYPPQSALEANSRKKKVYEQQENEENPLRCPVKLYEFYISKCPESVRTRNDVFYLMPERSCVPDSPVWYSTQALGREALAKMLHRVKMVKEINIALLTS